MSDFATASLPGQTPIIKSLLKDVSVEALEQLRFWLEQNPPGIPITSLPGYAVTIPQRAMVPTQQGTTSTTYVDLATVGPTVTSVSPGQYLILVSAWMWSNTAAQAAFMVPTINGVALSDAEAAIVSSGAANAGSTAFGVAVQRLTLDNNTVGAKYRSSAVAATATFQYRNLVVIRMSN